jgi:hypothetical protein
MSQLFVYYFHSSSWLIVPQTFIQVEEETSRMDSSTGVASGIHPSIVSLHPGGYDPPVKSLFQPLLELGSKERKAPSMAEETMTRGLFLRCGRKRAGLTLISR